MKRVLFVLSCMACGGHTRRLQMNAETPSGHDFEQYRKALGTFLYAINPAQPRVQRYDAGSNRLGSVEMKEEKGFKTGFIDDLRDSTKIGAGLGSVASNFGSRVQQGEKFGERLREIRQGVQAGLKDMNEGFYGSYETETQVDGKYGRYKKDTHWWNDEDTWARVFSPNDGSVKNIKERFIAFNPHEQYRQTGIKSYRPGDGKGENEGIESTFQYNMGWIQKGAPVTPKDLGEMYKTVDKVKIDSMIRGRFGLLAPLIGTKAQAKAKQINLKKAEQRENDPFFGRKGGKGRGVTVEGVEKAYTADKYKSTRPKGTKNPYIDEK